MANEALKKRMRELKVSQWQVADFIGVHEMTLSKWFRYELEGEKLKAVNEAIKAISEARNIKEF